MQFQQATKEQAKLRLAVFGPSGSGKTFTSLRLATGLGGRIAVIDTERGSASKYADRFAFDVLELPARDIDTYCKGIGLAAGSGYSVLIVDSLTHAWHELLDEVEKLARAKYQGNTWSAWSEGTPKQRQLVDAILDFDGHVIATMRTKTEWTTTKDNRGKTRPVRVGLAPEQGKGIEYEFDLLMEITPEHVATVIKDRTGKYQDQMIDCPGEQLGQDLAAWLHEGAAPAPKPEPAPPPAPAPKPKPETRQKRDKRDTNGDAPSRPLTAEQVRNAIRAKAGWRGDSRLDSEPVTEKQPGDVAGLLEAALDGMPAGSKASARHDILEYLVGVRTTSKLTKAEASAIIAWLKDAESEGWDVNEWATAETARVLTAFAESQGQQAMEMPC